MNIKLPFAPGDTVWTARRTTKETPCDACAHTGKIRANNNDEEFDCPACFLGKRNWNYYVPVQKKIVKVFATVDLKISELSFAYSLDGDFGSMCSAEVVVATECEAVKIAERLNRKNSLKVPLSSDVIP